MRPVKIRPVVAGAGALLAVAVAALHFMPMPSGAPGGASATAPARRIGAPTPSFARPEEADRYREAVIEGNRRALGIIDEALQEARRKPNVDAEYVRKLERIRAERSARLDAYPGTTP